MPENTNNAARTPESIRKACEELRTAWLDMVTIVNSRMLAAERAILGDGYTPPLPASVSTVGASLGTRVGLIGPITSETGQKLMGLLVAISNGTVDDAVREALRKHCEKRFGASDLTKLNEAMGQQLVQDLENVQAGKHELAYNEDGAMIFSNWSA